MKLLSVLSLLAIYGRQSTGCSVESELTEVFAPLPNTNDPVVPPEGYFVESFGKGAYLVSDGAYQAFFLVSTEGVVLVDAPPTIGKKIGYAIGNITDQPVTHLIYSHSHADHIGAARLFAPSSQPQHPHGYHRQHGWGPAGRGGEIIAHEETLTLLKQTPDPNRPFPTQTFRDKMTVQVGNQTLELSYKGPVHEPGNIFIYAPQTKTIMVVDVIYPGWVPFASLAESTNIPVWVGAHDDILAYDFDRYLGGHLGRPGSRVDVETQKEYVQDLFRNCNESVNLSGTDNPVVGLQSTLQAVSKNNPGNLWAQFKVSDDLVAEYCANKTNEKWLNRLNAADVYGLSNALSMSEAIRIAWGNLGPFADL